MSENIPTQSTVPNAKGAHNLQWFQHADTTLKLDENDVKTFMVPTSSGAQSINNLLQNQSQNQQLFVNSEDPCQSEAIVSQSTPSRYRKISCMNEKSENYLSFVENCSDDVFRDNFHMNRRTALLIVGKYT